MGAYDAECQYCRCDYDAEYVRREALMVSVSGSPSSRRALIGAGKKTIVNAHVILRHATNRKTLFEYAANRPRSSIVNRLAARTAVSSSSTIKPVTPSSTTSGTEPRRIAITGVPQAIASIIAKPNGSRH